MINLQTPHLPSRSLEQLLSDINRQVPAGIDWKAGAETYLQQVFKRDGRENVEPYLLHKPFARLQGDPDDQSRAVFLDLLHNFSNVVQVLRLPAGARILDIACGAGWLSQWLMRLGFHVTGVDMSTDLLSYARQRIESDSLLNIPSGDISALFVEHDVESNPLPERVGMFDAAIFESCLHHFYNPVNALAHVAQTLKEDGVAVLIEGENRDGQVKPEYLQVMREFATLERPYSRSELRDILYYAGLPYVEFFGPVNGWYRPDSAQAAALPDYVRTVSDSCNRCICAKSAEALRRVVPGWQPSGAQIVVPRRGISAGMPGYCWSAPYSELLVQHFAPRLSIHFGSHLPEARQSPQRIAIATNNGYKTDVVLSPASAAASVEMLALAAGTEIHLVSDGVFSPCWDGSDDRRVLSFWISIADETGRSLLPAAD